MNIIHDDDGFGLFMIPLFVDWHIRRCNIRGCTNQPSTIVTAAEQKDGTPVDPFGLCEDHYKQVLAGTMTKLDLIWDGFDAFKKPEEKHE